jgi:hypothetical protein
MVPIPGPGVNTYDSALAKAPNETRPRGSAARISPPPHLPVQAGVVLEVDEHLRGAAVGARHGERDGAAATRGHDTPNNQHIRARETLRERVLSSSCMRHQAFALTPVER